MPSMMPVMSAISRGLAADLAHRLDHAAHYRVAARGHLGGVGRQRIGLARVVGVLLHGGGQLFHARGGFLQRGGLLLGARGQIGIAGRDLAGAGGDVLGGRAYLGQQRHQAALHLVHRGQHAAGGRLPGARHRAQVAGSDALRDARQLGRLGAELAQQAARDEDAGRHRDGDRDQADRHQQRAFHRVTRLGLDDQLGRAAAGGIGIGVRGLDQRGQQRPALLDDLGDRGVVLACQREAVYVERDRPVQPLDARDLGGLVARLVRHVACVRDHPAEFLEMGFDALLGREHGGLFQLHVGRRADQHEVAHGHRAIVDGGADRAGHVGACVDAVDVAIETLVRVAERLQGEARDDQDDQAQRAEREQEGSLGREMLETHGMVRSWAVKRSRGEAGECTGRTNR